MKLNLTKTNYSKFALKFLSTSLLSFFLTSVIHAQNPLAAAMDFNILTEEDFTISAGDIEGAMGIGGNFNVLGSSQYPQLNFTGKQPFVEIGGIKYALIAGMGIQGVSGAQTFQINSKSGALNEHNVFVSTLYGASIEENGGGLNIGTPATDPNFRYLRVNQTNQSGTSVQNNTPIFNFATAFTNLRNESARISTKSNTVNVSAAGGQAFLTLTANTVNVWNVTGTELNSYSQLNLSGNLPSATTPLVINVNAAGTYNWTMFKFNISGENDNQFELNRAPYVVWNFYNNTTTLNINASILLIGSILAPNAIVTNNATGNITGQLVAKAFNKPNAGEFHIAKFNASIPTGVLAAKFIEVTPVYNNNEVTVKWFTTGETNSKYFELERSYNNTNFVIIGKTNTLVPNGGNANYSLTDHDFDVTAGTIYYRIKVTDNNGKTSYSSIATLKMNSGNTLNVWPNPFTNSLNITFKADKAGPIQVNLINNNGKKVNRQKFNISKGINSLKLSNLQNIATGNYYVEIIENTNKKTTAKIIKL